MRFALVFIAATGCAQDLALDAPELDDEQLMCCLGGGRTYTPLEVCGNGIDDDGDGQVDEPICESYGGPLGGGGFIGSNIDDGAMPPMPSGLIVTLAAQMELEMFGADGADGSGGTDMADGIPGFWYNMPDYTNADYDINNGIDGNGDGVGDFFFGSDSWAFAIDGHQFTGLTAADVGDPIIVAEARFEPAAFDSSFTRPKSAASRGRAPERAEHGHSPTEGRM
jgi:hypothetical protein